jgi:RHS repeat-associated protein
LDAMGVTRSMTWGLDLSGTEQGAGGVGGLLWTVDDNDDGMIPGYDGNGNIIAWVDASDGSLAGTREYGAFGEDVTFSGVAHEIPFGFSTKYQDSLSGLYYYGYRYYNASTGRWLSRDPLEEQGGLNLYGILGNNLVNLWDLLGLTSCDKEWEIDVDSIIMVTTLKTGATATVQDPESVIKGYIGDRVKDRIKEAAEKRNRFLTMLKEAQRTAKSFLGRVGFVSEAVLSTGLMIDSISMNVEFRCCKCDGPGGLKWEKMESGFESNGLWFSLRLAGMSHFLLKL